MTTVVISQPMFFPWVGMFEQIRLADVYVHYDDVQFSKGSFVNRVQIKTAEGSKWLTIPLRERRKLGRKINELAADVGKDWRAGHRAFLEQAYRAAPHCGEMLAIVDGVHSKKTNAVAGIVVDALDEVCRYFGLEGRRFEFASRLGVGGSGSERVLAVVKRVGGDVYVTGHGAKNYLDHEAFERAGVRVEYMNYRRTPYSQLHGEFNPHVSILDLIANVGRAGRDIIHSGTVPWREFVA